MRVVLLLAAFALALAAPAFADEDENLERARLMVLQCTTSAAFEDDFANCRGVGARPCIEADGGTTPGLVLCWSAEGDGWERFMQRAVARIHAEQGDTAEAFDATQTAWLAYVDAECSYRGARWGLGSGAQVDMVRCNADLTADRAIAVWRYSRTRD